MLLWCIKARLLLSSNRANCCLPRTTAADRLKVARLLVRTPAVTTMQWKILLLALFAAVMLGLALVLNMPSIQLSIPSTDSVRSLIQWVFRMMCVAFKLIYAHKFCVLATFFTVMFTAVLYAGYFHPNDTLRGAGRYFRKEVGISLGFLYIQLSDFWAFASKFFPGFCTASISCLLAFIKLVVCGFLAICSYLFSVLLGLFGIPFSWLETDRWLFEVEEELSCDKFVGLYETYRQAQANPATTAPADYNAYLAMNDQVFKKDHAVANAAYQRQLIEYNRKVADNVDQADSSPPPPNVFPNEYQHWLKDEDVAQNLKRKYDDYVKQTTTEAAALPAMDASQFLRFCRVRLTADQNKPELLSVRRKRGVMSPYNKERKIINPKPFVRDCP